MKRRDNNRLTGSLPRVLLWSLVSCFILSIQNLALAVYGLVQAQHGGDWPVHAEVAEVIQCAVWALLGVNTFYSWNRKEEKFSPLVRAWWIVGFVLSLSTLIPNFVVTESWNVVIAVVETSTIPICTFLFVLAVRGMTGIVEETDSLKESLLNKEGKDDLQAQGPGVTPHATAGLFSLATVSWISPLIAKGAKNPLELKDVPLPAMGDQASFHYARFKENWDNEVKTRDEKSPSVYKAVAITFWRRALFNAVIAGVNSVAVYVGPYLIEDFVEYLAGRRRFPHEGAVLVSMFFLSKVVEILAQRQWYLGMQFLGLNFNSALTAFVYRKGLVLSNQARQGHTSGEIINYVTVDVERIGDFSWYFQDIWIYRCKSVLHFWFCTRLWV